MHIVSKLEDPNPGKQLNKLGQLIKEVFQLIPSDKHMSGRDLGRLCSTPALKYRAFN